MLTLSQVLEQQKRKKSKQIQQPITIPRFNGQLVTVHQLDCIYYGEINRSYHKQGFGILQTIQFETYFGFWKNDKAEGIGAIIYPSGQIIYGQFQKNDLCGIGIIDDGKKMRVGVFDGIDNVGVGYEYEYSIGRWKMLRYSKGVAVGKIKQQNLRLQEGVPQMITAQHSIYQIYKNYIDNKWFYQDNYKKQVKKQKQKISKREQEKQQNRVKYSHLNPIVFSLEENGDLMVGFRDEGNLHGLCCIYNYKERRLIEAGYYKGGLLDGYGYYSPAADHKMIGTFINGIKQGLFYEVNGNQKIGNQWDEDNSVRLVDFNEEQLKKKQRAHNYEQKDFLSAKNLFELNRLFQTFLPPEVRHSANRSLKSQINYSQPANDQLPNQNRPIPRTAKRGQILQKQKISHTYLNSQQKGDLNERSSISIIRQKLKDYELIKQEDIARNNSVTKQKKMIAQTLGVFDEQEEEIAIEENPFDSVMIGKGVLHQSKQKRPKG